MSLDVTKPLIDVRTLEPVRYVGVGTAAFPIVCVCPTAAGRDCVRQYGLDGRANDDSSIISNPEEPEDWS